MNVKPINSVIRKQFQSLFNTANEQAKKDFATNIETKLQGLDDFNQLKILIEESDKLKAVIEKSEYPYYIKNHSSEDWLLNQFASRAFLLNVDESKQLSEAVRLGSYKSLISESKWKFKDIIPEYTYKDFLSGKIDPYLANFESYYNIKEEEYYKIRTWQSDNLVKIITYESLMLIKKIQQHCTTLKNPLEFIIAEKEKIENTLEKAEGDTTKIKSAFAELFIFNKQKLHRFKDDMLQECYSFYQSDKINWKFIFPVYINPLIEKVNQKADTVFSNEATIFFTINKISEWFELVIAGQPLQQPVTEIEWDKLFKNIEDDAASQIEKLVAEIADYVEKPERKKKEIKHYLLDQLENYRYKFNEFEEKYIFTLLSDDRKYMLKEMFRTNSFFGNELANQTKNITEALVIQEVSWEICGFYGSIFDTHKMDYPEKDAAHIEIMFLMHQMVLDKELYDAQSKIMDDFMQHFHSYSLPIEMHFQNNRVMMKELFHKALDRLQTHLEDAEPTNKILFMQSRLKQLRHRELELKKFEHDRDFSKREFRYSKLFKEFLEIEADFIRETKDITFLPALPQGKTTLQIAAPPQTFDTLLSKKKATFILQMLEDMSITIDGKSNLSPRRKGALRGVVEASIEKNILPQQSIDNLCKLLADKIGLQLTAKLDFSTTSETNRKDAIRYITEHYKA